MACADAEQLCQAICDLQAEIHRELVVDGAREVAEGQPIPYQSTGIIPEAKSQLLHCLERRSKAILGKGYHDPALEPDEAGLTWEWYSERLKRLYEDLESRKQEVMK